MINMYKAENVKILCERNEDELEKSIRRYNPGGYIPKSISQTSQGDYKEKCVLLVKMIEDK